MTLQNNLNIPSIEGIKKTTSRYKVDWLCLESGLMRAMFNMNLIRNIKYSIYLIEKTQ